MTKFTNFFQFKHFIINCLIYYNKKHVNKNIQKKIKKKIYNKKHINNFKILPYLESNQDSLATENYNLSY